MPRCPNGTRKNKKTGICEPVLKKSPKSTTQKKSVKRRTKTMEIDTIRVTIGVSPNVKNCYVIKNIVFISQSKVVGFDFDFTDRINLEDTRKLIYLRDKANPDNMIGDIGSDDIEIDNKFELNAFLKKHNFDTIPKKIDKSLISIGVTIVHDVSDEDEVGEYGLLFNGYNYPDVKRDDGSKNPKNIDVVHRDVSGLLSEFLSKK